MTKGAIKYLDLEMRVSFLGFQDLTLGQVKLMRHVDLWAGEKNLLADAGTFSYNSYPDMAWYFSGTVSHNTIELDGRNQMPKLGRFFFGG